MKISFFKSLTVKLSAFATLMALSPISSWACAVCGANEGEAYLWSTFLLMGLPLATAGLIIFYIYRKFKKAAQSQED